MTEPISPPMNTASALAELGIDADDLTESQRRDLDDNGYVVIPDVFSPEEVRELRSEFDRLEALDSVVMDDYNIEPGGSWLINLFNKSKVFDLCFKSKPTFEAARYLLGEVKIACLNGRNPPAGFGQQLLHSDTYRSGPNDWRVTNTLILLDDVTLDNGPTRVVPGSHKWPALNVPHDFDLQVSNPEHEAADDLSGLTPEERALIPADPLAPHPQEVYVTGRSGSICIINGSIWHGGTTNTSGDPRRVLHFAVCRRDVPPEIIQRDHLTPSLRSRTSAAQKYLLDIEDADAVAPDPAQ